MEIYDRVCLSLCMCVREKERVDKVIRMEGGGGGRER